MPGCRGARRGACGSLSDADGLTFVLRTEHLTEAKAPTVRKHPAHIGRRARGHEPLGMGGKTLVFFRIGGMTWCARVSTAAGRRGGRAHAARQGAAAHGT